MSRIGPIFENVQSPLYTSNDGLLKVDRVDNLERTGWILTLRGRLVFSTFERTLVDAYIAGYDLAREDESEGAALQRAADELGIQL